MAKKKAPDAAPAASDDKLPRLSQHPRARRQIREAKAWAGVVGFVLVALLSMQAGLTVFDAGVRALCAGIACYLIGWTIAVVVWSHLAQAEVALRQKQLAEQAQQ
jgi:hypothetical protein